MIRPFIAGAVVVAAATSGSNLLAGPITVPNGSFESPPTGFVSVNVDSWQKSPKPDWYDEGGGFLWTQLAGLFKNPALGSADHIDNCDGNQAIWLFAVPGVSVFQDYDTVDSDDPVPTHAFDATYAEGKAYRLRVGVVGTGGGMQQGATLELGLYYRDAASNKVSVSVATITNLATVFSNNTHLVDFSVAVPRVKAGDAWTGRHIGIQVLSTVTTNLQGGYWDLDNVRLSSVQEPELIDPVASNGRFQFTLKSEPGLAVEILSTTDSSLPMAAWPAAAVVTNTLGTTVYSDALGDSGRLYGARSLSPSAE